ncbi:MAG: hypothetical protein ACREPM_07320 [Gemmatimonadaceae bacterium]
MRPILCALLGLSMAAGAARAAGAQDDRLAIVPDSARRTVGPGSFTTARVVVQELAGVDQDVVIHARLPDGWRLLTEPVTTRVPAKGRAFRLVQFQVPADAEAGEYTVVYSVRAPGLDSDLESRTTVVVTIHRSIAVSLVDEPIFAASGSRIHTTFLVTNRGNATTRVRLRARTDAGVSAAVDTLSELKPGESRTVGVDVDAGQSPNGDELIRHVALVADADGGTALDDGPAQPAAASVRVVPRSASADAPLFSLPANLRLMRTQSNGAAYSFELSGLGALREGSNTTVEFLARGPQPAQFVFSERDEYRVAITSSVFSLRLGDQMFRLSPLTDPGSPTSGVSLCGLRGDWSAGAQAGTDRWNLLPSSQRTVFVKFAPVPAFSISANAMESSGLRSGSLGTLYMRALPSAHSFLEVEQGMGVGGAGTGAGATMMRVAGDQGWIAFDARAVRSDSGYLTESSGTRAFGTVTLRPTGWLRLAGRTNLEPGRQTSELTTELVRMLAAGVRSSSYDGSDFNRCAVLARFGTGIERSAWVRLAGSSSRVSAIATFERGSLNHRDGTAAIPFSTSRIQTGLRLASAASVAGFVERTTGQRLYMLDPATVVTAGASTSLRLGAVSLTVVGAAAPGSRFRIVPDSAWTVPGSTASLDAAIGYTLPTGRAISLRLHATSAGPGRPIMTVARISYDIPLHLPIGHSRTVGRVMGRVYDAETGAGVPNALVRLGDRVALSDDEGRVAFGGLAPSRYPVRVDLGALQAGGSGLEDRLLEVDALAGHTTDMGIRVTHMGLIAGTISLFERTGLSLNAADSARLRRVRGLGGIVVTFANGSEERRALTRPDGSFELRDARPGVWRVTVAAASLPRDHVVEGDSVRVIDLAAGATQQVELRVTPRVRKILPLDAAPSASPKVQPNAPPNVQRKVQPDRQPTVQPTVPTRLPSVSSTPSRGAVRTRDSLAAPSEIVVKAKPPVTKAKPLVTVKASVRATQPSPKPPAPIAPRPIPQLSMSWSPLVAETSMRSRCPLGAAILPALATTCRP